MKFSRLLLMSVADDVLMFRKHHLMITFGTAKFKQNVLDKS